MTTETSPPPPPNAVSPTVGEDRGPVWSVATGIFWGLVFAAFIGVWKASQEVGIATWWRGPRSEPRPILVQVLPLMAPSAMIVGSVLRWPRLALAGVVGALVTLAIGAGDLGPVPKLAVVELAVGASALVFSLAALAAQRAVRPADPAP